MTLRNFFWALGINALSIVPAYAEESESDTTRHPSLPQCRRDDPGLLLPDLVPDPPSEARNIYQAGRRVVQFTTAVGNIGDGPLMIEGRTISTSEGLVTQGWQLINRRDGSRCARLGGLFEFHATHAHWHFGRFMGYELRARDGGALVADAGKASFCLLDVESIQGYHPNRYPIQVNHNRCITQEGTQGISVGWKDVYDRLYPEQIVPLDRDASSQVPPGSYLLVNSVDPEHALWELRTDNNTSVSAVNVILPPPDLSVVPEATPRTRPPRVRLGRSEVTPTAQAVPTRRARPTPRLRAPRPARPTPRPIAARPVAPTRTPRSVVPTRTPTPGQVATGCNDACRYQVSQIRMTWYDHLGLNLSALVAPGSCPQLVPDSGEPIVIEMRNWLTQARVDTGLEHTDHMTLSDDGLSAVSATGSVQLGRRLDKWTMTYRTNAPAIARGDDALNFPVVFDLCMRVGEQAVGARLVCQPKSTGMLCHQG